jgi:hypothetical protein
MRTEEDIRDRLSVLASIERELLRHPPATNVENALRQVRNKVSILRWVLGEVPHI